MKKGQLSFEINSHYQNLSIIRNIIRNFLDIEKISTLDKVHFISVVDELSTNAIEHAYKNADANEYNPIYIMVNIDSNFINFTIEDYGEGFQDDTKSKDEGGMGLNIVKSIVNEFKIIKRKKGTKINIIKEIKKEE
ncbi:MAG: ATP-binding protein [Fusobacteria bacterium]|jgi:serine/threonine-protein kinase RsbW|nr:ATP-binding protein [Fusobacteriota bacterium]